MSTEIERKYLTNNDFKDEVVEENNITQGYLSTDVSRTVRVRIKNNKGFLTIKGKSDSSFLSRFEWEKEIPLNEAKELLKLCIPTVINKTRYILNYKGMVFEIDEFHDQNKGLVIAEVELENINQDIELPSFIGKEITQDKRYYNSYLSQHPYSTW